MVHNLPDKYLWHPENFHKARNLLDYVVKNWELVKEFKPFYRQNWGEGVAGRQSVIYIYHYKGI
jgi:hypothetical protein